MAWIVSSRAVYPSVSCSYFRRCPCSRSASAAVGELVVVGDERSGVPHRAEVLRRVEAERRREPARPGAKPVPDGARRLAGVLDQRQAERSEAAHVRELPVEMDGEHEARAPGHRGGRGVRVEVEVVLLDVGDDRDAAGLRHRLERRDEGHRRHDHLLAALEARRDQRETQRVEAARHADAAGNAGLGGERLLEARDGGAVDERARVDEPGEVLEELRRERGVCPAEVHERHGRGTRLHGGRSVIAFPALVPRCKTPQRDGARRARAPPQGCVEPRERQRHMCAAGRAQEPRRAGDPPEGRIPSESSSTTPPTCASPRTSTFSSTKTGLDAVEAALPDLGFRYLGVTVAEGSRRRRRAWVHEQTGIPVELHTSITGMDAPPDVVWAVLSEETEVEAIGPCTAEILNPPATALHIALNVAHHGRANAKTMADLERALERVSPATWQAAAELAERVDALPAFAAGLRLDPRGDALLARARRRCATDAARRPSRGDRAAAGAGARMARGAPHDPRAHRLRRTQRLSAARLHACVGAEHPSRVRLARRRVLLASVLDGNPSSGRASGVAPGPPGRSSASTRRGACPARVAWPGVATDLHYIIHGLVLASPVELPFPSERLRRRRDLPRRARQRAARTLHPQPRRRPGPSVGDRALDW